MKSGIYTITNLVNGKMYIGFTNNFLKRKQYHFQDLKNNRHHNCLLQRAWNKYGEDNFEFEILEEFPNDLHLLSSMEHYWCTMLNTHDRNYGYNILPTSHIPYRRKLSKESIEKMIKTRKENSEKIGYYFSEETKRKMANSRKNYKHSEETKLKIKEILSKIDLTPPPQRIAKTVETRKNNGKPWHTQETRKKMSEAAKGKKKNITEKVIARYKNQCRKIEQYDKYNNLIKQWNSIKEASETLNISAGTIGNTCRFNQKAHKFRKVKGYIWKYMQED